MESQETPGKQIEGHGATAFAAMESQSSKEKKKKERFLDFLRALRSRAPRAFLRRVATLGALSATHSTPAVGCARFFLRAPAFARTVDWRLLRRRCTAWARHPTNAALLVWLGFVSAGVAFVFLLMTGALNSAVPDAARRRRWAEAANQVLNALFTVMCVYQHPRLFHHLALLLRWPAADAAALRAVYCKHAGVGLGPRRRERLHVAVVPHPPRLGHWAVNLCMGFGLAAPVAAALYMVYGPLGRKTTDEEAAAAAVRDDVTTGSSSSRKKGRVAVAKAEWAGGLFDVADDPTAAAVSAACTACVFGWNMERLGLGNMYVHVVTFALLCAAPVLVFAVAALNVHDPALGSLVGAAGALLSVLGLTYGGFWRVQMRRRLGLPADRALCGGRPAAADYAKWLLCALAQEVRTGNLYDLEDGSLYARGRDEDDREGRVAPLTADKARGDVEDVVAVDAPPAPVRVER
ncbi:hypothetical protein BS78_05G009200 [Paspalum vaginatum]|nr:hypothetical protein BS78_05G009200 [Paspalum vaginatum]